VTPEKDMDEQAPRRRIVSERLELPGDTLDEQPINPLHYVSVLLKRRWLIVIGTAVLVILVGAYTKLTMTPAFTAEVKFLPSKASDMSARMSTIVGGGMQLNGSDDTASVDYYTALLQSPLFLERIIKKSFSTRKLGGPRPLLDYFEIDADSEPIRLQKGIEALAGSVKVSAGRPTGGRVSLPIITISVETSEAGLSAAVGNAFLDELLFYNQSIRNSKAIQTRVFIEKQLKDNQALLNKAESDLAMFTAHNRKIATPDLDAEKDRLTRSLKVQEEVFITLKKQLELARIEEQENQPSIEILERAVPPLRKSSPSGLLSVELAGVVGLMLFCGLALALDLVKTMDPEDEATKEFLRIIQDVKADFPKLRKALEIESSKKLPASKETSPGAP